MSPSPTRWLLLWSAAIALISGTAGIAASEDSAAARAASADRACLMGMQRAASKVAKAQARDAEKCLQARAMGEFSATQADRCLVDDLAGRVEKARAKAGSIESAKCRNPPDFGFTEAMTLSRVAATEGVGLIDELFGPNFGESVILRDDDAQAASCQRQVLSAANRVAAAEWKEFSRCTRRGLKRSSITDGTSLDACLDTMATDEKGKIAKARTTLTDTIAMTCAAPASTLPGPCSAAADVASCLSDRISCRTCLMAAEATGLDRDCDLFDDGSANLSCIHCNGAASLCDRRFDEVVYATSHNAMSNRADGWIGPNHARSVPDQLAAGIRSLMLDTWIWDGEVVLCHGGEVFPGVGCNILGMRPLAEGLAELTAYLDTHPHEVLSIIFESYISEADTQTGFVDSSLIDYVHEQSLSAPWPTLRELVSSNKRLVVFTDRGDSVLPWHHYVWSHAWETPFSALVPDDLQCDSLRGSTSNSLVILNHFLTNPLASPSLASTVNQSPFLLDRARRCQDEHQDLPNFITVDFEEIGSLYPTVRTLNRLP